MLVTNHPPEFAHVGPDLQDMLVTFRNLLGPDTRPYVHQAKVWEQYLRREETFLVAGTASGKTLAMAVPLFHKLFPSGGNGSAGHAVWLYPTVALLEDQQRVLARLSEAIGRHPDETIGHLQGGMPRTELVRNLNKPVVLATPDEVYWFFHKNVKYSGLLIYGLALVDDFVIDEAHLFNGLMLPNLAHLKQRI